jgi:hypothetical protein
MQFRIYTIVKNSGSVVSYLVINVETREIGLENLSAI